MVTKMCAESGKSVGHEIAHLFGCVHNKYSIIKKLFLKLISIYAKLSTSIAYLFVALYYRQLSANSKV